MAKEPKSVKDLIVRTPPKVPPTKVNPREGLGEGNLMARNYMDNLQNKQGAGSQLPSAAPLAPDAKAAIMAKMNLTPSSPSASALPQMGAQATAPAAITPAKQEALANLLVTLGKDEAGKPIQEDLGTMPHMMIAGQTGSGKSYKMNEMLQELMHNNTPDNLKMMLVDPKGTEFPNFDNKYSVLPKGAIKDPESAVSAMTWLEGEMDHRLKNGISSPKIVLAVDELADLLMNSPPSVQRTLTRLAQKSRSAGINMMLATQRPDAGVLKGLMKANIPARMAFKTPDSMNSRIILGRTGAEGLEPHQSMYMSPLHGVPEKLFPTSYTGPAPAAPELAKEVMQAVEAKK